MTSSLISPIVSTSNLEKVIRYALGTNTCISTSGVVLPQEMVALNTGMSQMTVSRAIRYLMNSGILIKVSMEKAHCKAAKYQFCGFWLSLAIKIHSKPSDALSDQLRTITDSLTDGNWNNTLFKMTNYFQSEKAYLDYIQENKGIELKQKPERLKQAVNAWKCHTKLDELKLNTNQRKQA